MIMNRWLKKFSVLMAVAAIGFWLAGAPAYALDLTPTTTEVFGLDLGPANCEPGCVYNAFGLPNDGSLNLLYKADVGTVTAPATVESGVFTTSYATTFLSTPLDPSGATITHVAGTDAISCPSCYLAIKDGSQNPSYYFYDLSAWNGTEAINLSGFWPQQGAISHVSIWGTSTVGVPEPSSLLLLGSGLAGIGIWRRKFAKG